MYLSQSVLLRRRESGAISKREYILDEDGNRVKDAKGKEIFNAVSTTGWNDPELLKENGGGHGQRK